MKDPVKFLDNSDGIYDETLVDDNPDDRICSWMIYDSSIKDTNKSSFPQHGRSFHIINDCIIWQGFLWKNIELF